MKNYILNVLLFFMSISLFSQVTFDFKNSQDALGWVKAGGASDASIVSDGLAISWNGSGDAKPKITHQNLNVDASLYKIFAITVINDSDEVERVRALHFKANTGTDPLSSAGTNTRYTFFNVSKGPSKTYYFDLTNAQWKNYDYGGDSETDFDHMSVVLADNNNGGFAIASSEGGFIIEKIEFLEEVPSTPRSDFTFDIASDTEGFVGANGVSLSQPVAGTLQVTIDGSNKYPNLTQSGLYAVDGTANKGLRIKIINDSPKNKITFVSPSGAAEYASVFNIPANDPITVQTIDFDLSNLTNWTGEQNGYKLQFIEEADNGEGGVAITESAGTIHVQQIMFTSTYLGVDENVAASVGLYPNPVSTTLNITADSEVATVEIYNVVGSKVIAQVGGNTLDVSELASGVYIVQVKLMSGGVRSEKILKD